MTSEDARLTASPTIPMAYPAARPVMPQAVPSAVSDGVGRTGLRVTHRGRPRGARIRQTASMAPRVILRVEGVSRSSRLQRCTECRSQLPAIRTDTTRPYTAMTIGAKNPVLSGWFPGAWMTPVRTTTHLQRRLHTSEHNQEHRHTWTLTTTGIRDFMMRSGLETAY